MPSIEVEVEGDCRWQIGRWCCCCLVASLIVLLSSARAFEKLCVIMARLFSTREDKAIIEFVRNSDKSWRGNALYRDLAKQMPSRSWQSVKSRFVKVRTRRVWL